MHTKRRLFAVFAMFAATLMFPSACANVAPDHAPSAAVCPEPEECPTLPPTGTPEDPSFTQGSRLKPIMLAASDGTKARVEGRWHDTELGVPCEFSAPDGGDTMYCLPDATFADPNWFSDDQCTQSVMVHNVCGKYPKYAKVAPQNACFAEVTSFRELSAPYDMPDMSLWWRSAKGECTAQGTAAGTKVVLPMGPALPWDMFVSATLDPK